MKTSRYATRLALLAASFTLFACVERSAAPSAKTAAAAQGAPLTSYLREPLPAGKATIESSIEEHLQIPGVEGHLLDTWILRPDDRTEPVPIVLVVTPYYGGGSLRHAVGQAALGGGFDRLWSVLLAQGYAVGLSSVRGTGNSEGCFTQGDPSEGRDTAAVIQQLAAQPWANGSVGLIGVSYDGTTPQDVWVEAPPALKTIVPISGISDFYKYNFVNGVPIDIQGLGFNTYYWGMVGLAPAGLEGGAQAADAPSVPGAIAGEVCTQQVDVQYGGVTSTVDGNKDGYWQQRDFLLELQQAPRAPTASVFYVHGLQDWNVKPHMMEGWLDAIQNSGVPFKIWLGQWAHAWPQSGSGTCQKGSPCRNDWWDRVLLAWFDQFLKGHETGILAAPAVQVQNDNLKWRHESNWPPASLRSDAWYLNGQDMVTAAGSGAAAYYDYNGTIPPSTGPQGPDRVIFRSAPLAQDMTFSGQPVFRGKVTASGARASLMLTLAEEKGSTLRAFNFAAQSLNHVQSLESGAADISGLTQDVTVRFFPQDDTVKKGSRLVLIAAGDLIGSPAPSLIPISTGSTITLDLASASLSLPVNTALVYEDPQPFGVLKPSGQ